jgi:tetratricopeptide (TPR) repeat protein
MQVNLNSTPRKLIFALVCVVGTALYLAIIGGHYLAVTLAAQSEPRTLRRAVSLEPWNAAWRSELGRYLLFVAQDEKGAVASLEKAVAMNSHVAQYWLDLAVGFEVAGDTQRQRIALESALQAEPTAPNVAWQVANFYLVGNDVVHALPLFRVVMQNDAEQMNAALNLCWRITQNPTLMLRQAVPPEPLPYFAFLKLLTEKGNGEAAEVVWNGLMNLGQPFPVTDAFPYFDYLIQKHDTGTAVQVWKELVKRSPQLQSYSQPGNLIVDGGLEKNFLNGGFDWRYSVKDSVQLSVDHSEFHRGNQALRVAFQGPAVSDSGFFEYVPVLPNTDYRFSIYTKSEDIESASGPRVAVLDAYSGQPYVLTDDSLGTIAWRQQVANFRTRRETSLLVVKVSRVPSDPLIKGKFWIDDVSLVQL